MPQHVGDTLLNDTIDGMREQAVDIAEAGIDVGRLLQLRRLRSRVAQQGIDAFRQAQFVDIERPQPIQDAPVRVLQRLHRLEDTRDRTIELRLVARARVQQGDRVGADAKQQRASSS